VLAISAVWAFANWRDRTRVFGDSGSPWLEVCDARAFLEGRPQVDHVGCFVRVAGGRFLAGAQSAAPGAPGFDAEAADDEGPPREVDVPTIYLQKEEVSRMQYAACVSAGACAVGPRMDTALEVDARSEPVRLVTWHDAVAYCAYTGGRLPTELEWEFAARGTESRRYPWGAAPPDCDRAHFDQSGAPGCGLGRPVRVNQFPTRGESPALQLHLAGNVWEWVADAYRPDRSPGTPAATPERRVQKGGGYTDDAWAMRGSARGALEPDLRQEDLGFRCAADPDVVERGRWLKFGR